LGCPSGPPGFIGWGGPVQEPYAIVDLIPQSLTNDYEFINSII
jgi:hypothetical protein